MSFDGVGARARRKEDDRLLRGIGRFVDDFEESGQLHVRVVRSSSAHARVVSINIAHARGLPGVVDIITSDDLPPGLRIPVRIKTPDTNLEPFTQPPLAGDRVRYVGEPLVVVVATDPYLAEDAADQVEVEYDELPVVLNAVEDRAGGGGALFDEGNQPAVVKASFGDIDEAFSEAAYVASGVFDIGRHSGIPMETRGLLAKYDTATRKMEIWGATKVPHFNRSVLATLLDMPEHSIRMHAVDAGGGFGIRGEFYPEDFLVPWLSRRLSAPVKWVEDRVEHMISANHSRQQRHDLQIAFNADGTIRGVRDDVTHDNGAYIRTHGVGVAELTVTMFPGPYRIPAYQGAVTVRLSNKTPCGTYRSPGRFEGTFAREHLLDSAADELGIDRFELRRRNLLNLSEMPHRRAMSALGTDVILDAGDYLGLHAKATEHIEANGWTAEVEAIRAEGGLAGIGHAVFLEKSGLGPFEMAKMSVDPSGAVRLATGGTSLGQGIETVMAQIAAEQLGMGIESIDVVSGDTDGTEYGMGSFASRSTVVGGGAVHGAATALAERIKRVAGQILDVEPASLELKDGMVLGVGREVGPLSFGDVARACGPGSQYLNEGETPGLTSSFTFEVGHMTYPYGVHVGLVSVDPETGQVNVVRYLVAYEVGRSINPTLVEGQLIGGLAQGIGGALFEEFQFDDSGQPVAASFMDYLLPTATEMPLVDLIVAEDAPSPGNPLKTKGAGEGGLTAAGGAIANAVRDAIGARPTFASLPLRSGSVLDCIPGERFVPERQPATPIATKGKRRRQP